MDIENKQKEKKDREKEQAFLDYKK